MSQRFSIVSGNPYLKLLEEDRDQKELGTLLNNYRGGLVSILSIGE